MQRPTRCAAGRSDNHGPGPAGPGHRAGQHKKKRGGPQGAGHSCKDLGKIFSTCVLVVIMLRFQCLKSEVSNMIVNGFKSKAAAIRYLKSKGHPINSLLATPESNPKVAKNGKLDVLTAPLHLAPFDLSGFQVCPQASDGCAAACLHTAGNPAYMAQKDASRKAKTVAYFKERAAFMAVLAFEIHALQRKAEAKGMQAGIRLNATSDL